MIEENELKILDVVKRYGSISRPYIVRITKLPRTTVYDSLIRLQLCGYVIPKTQKRTVRGRPHTLWCVTPSIRTYMEETLK